MKTDSSCEDLKDEDTNSDDGEIDETKEDISLDIFAIHDDCPEARIGCSVAVFEPLNYVFVAGGMKGPKVFADLHIYNDLSWQHFKNFSKSKSCNQVYGNLLVVNGRLILFGGIDENHACVSSLRGFNFEDKTWELISTDDDIQPSLRFNAAAAMWDPGNCSFYEILSLT